MARPVAPPATPSGARACGARLARAHVLPFAVFMGFLLVLQLFAAQFGWDHPSAAWWRRWPEQWIYPLQTLVCLVLLVRYWRCYELRWSRWVLVGVACGALGIGIWLLPAAAYDWLGLAGETHGWLAWLGVAERRDGFDPGVFGAGAGFWLALALRFVRAVVVVALLEEIFWRGFLMRYLVRPEGDYWKVPFGQPAWRSYLLVTLGFVLAHPLDFALVAWVYGSIAYALAVVSRSLLACVVMHATANLLMGVYIMQTGKFGLW